MNGNIIDGKKIAKGMLLKLRSKIDILQQNYGLIPGLSIVQVGADPASTIYVNNKLKCALENGIKTFSHILPAEINQDDLLAIIKSLNANPEIHGIIVQLPMSPHINADIVLNSIDPDKDVDGFSWVNVGKLSSWSDCLESCTPQGAMILIKHALGDNLSGKKAVVLGRSRIVGRPMATMLIRENCTVTVAHSYSQEIAAEVKSADILVAATGSPRLVKAAWLKPGVCAIDIGIVRIENKLYGDIDFEEAVKVAGHITPVPGGVGPMTVACLMSNTVKAMCLQHNIKFSEL